MSRDTLLSLIDPDPDQPRKHIDGAGLAELAQSMQANGLIVPVLVRPAGDRFVLVHGERRWRAAQLLGWDSIPADVRDVSADEAHWLALIENVQRADLSPIEEARAYQERLAEGITQEVLAERIGKGRTYIAQKLRLLTLPDELQATIGAGQLAEGHGRQLLRLKDAQQQGDLGNRAAAEGWTVERTRAEVDVTLQPPLNIRPWPEIQRLQPPLTPAEQESFRADIEKVGVITPIAVMPDGRIIDGHVRWELSGGRCPYKVYDVSEEEALRVWAAFNLRRQHFTPDQKACIYLSIEKELEQEAAAGSPAAEPAGDLAYHEAKIDAALDELRAALAAELGPSWLTASYADLWAIMDSYLVKEKSDSYLADLGQTARPSDGDNPLEVAIWAEERMKYLATADFPTLLRRRNEYTSVQLRCERAAGGALARFKKGEDRILDRLGIDALLPMLTGKAPQLLTMKAKEVWKACPGAVLGPKGLEMPEGATPGQWLAVGDLLAQESDGQERAEMEALLDGVAKVSSV